MQDQDQSTAKSARTGEEEKQAEKPLSESELSEKDPNKDDTTGVPQDTTGKVIDEESYCPASPAPAKQGQNYPYSSPIFQKSLKKIVNF